MKWILPSIAALALLSTGCKKDWTCQTVQDEGGREDSVSYSTFHGTRSEMKQFEKDMLYYVEESGYAVKTPDPRQKYIDTQITKCH